VVLRETKREKITIKTKVERPFSREGNGPWSRSLRTASQRRRSHGEAQRRENGEEGETKEGVVGSETRATIQQIDTKEKGSIRSGHAWIHEKTGGIVLQEKIQENKSQQQGEGKKGDHYKIMVLKEER